MDLTLISPPVKQTIQAIKNTKNKHRAQSTEEAPVVPKPNTPELNEQTKESIDNRNI